ncbi:MAG: glycogen debranching protein, partial [Candidatus Aenigmarchaeota archaeon]|nr:glycogen debranching protein [Candidatus Aenigmarchaeota archaeon]
MQKYNSKTLLWLLLFLLAGTGCKDQPKTLYQSEQFSVFPDKVVQGNYVAKATSPTRIVSDYQSTVSESYSRLITFKFSINEKDNEMLSGIDHWIIIGDEHQSPVIQFGKDNGPIPNNPGTKLPVNYRYTFRIDMNQVLNQFKVKGFFETFDGSRIAKNDFKAVYIAGGSEPLTWDFSNLDENNLELEDPDKDGIFELTVNLNPYDTNQQETKEWILSSNVAAKPHYKSEQKLVDALYNLSLEEVLLNIEEDSTLRTGAKWGGVWTRDVSYS